MIQPRAKAISGKWWMLLKLTRFVFCFGKFVIVLLSVFFRPFVSSLNYYIVFLSSINNDGSCHQTKEKYGLI